MEENKEGAGTVGPNKQSTVTKFQSPKIKRIMQKNKEIGKIQRDVPILVGRAVNHFIKDLSR